MRNERREKHALCDVIRETDASCMMSLETTCRMMSLETACRMMSLETACRMMSYLILGSNV